LAALAPMVFVRTERHPAVAALGAVESFDHLYDEGQSFEEVYRAIVEAVVAAAVAQAPEPVLYAVPGSPLVAERTVELLRRDDRAEVTIVPALSFLDLAWERLGLDPLSAGIRLVDAEHFGTTVTDEAGPFLVAQCWSPSLLSDIKLSVDDEAGELPDVVLLHHLGLDDEQIVSVPWWDLDRTVAADHLTSLYIPALPREARVVREMARLEDLVLTLRERCPWDRVQTHATLMPHLVEESYEVLDALHDFTAVEEGTEGRSEASAHLAEELGDLLFQIVFHARLAQEEGRFTLADVARGVHDKLVHRHPHVFADVTAETADAVVSNWEAIKKAEKGRTSVTEGIPASLPALLLATKLQRKATSVGLVATEADLAQRLAALERQGAEGRDGADDALADGVGANEQAVGELLFAVADLSRRLGIDPEQALRSVALTFRDRVVAQEAAIDGA
jgi:tetrapyrrole methylase family protein/MazG family protein